MISMMRTTIVTVALAALAATAGTAQTTSGTITSRVQLLPDLIITSVRVSSPLGDRACIGRSNTLTVTIRNQGYLTRSSFVMGFGPYDPEWGGVVPRIMTTIASLAGGATQQVVFRGIEGYSGTGTPLGIAQIDTGFSVKESNESNNMYQRLPRLTGLTERCPLVRPTEPVRR